MEELKQQQQWDDDLKKKDTKCRRQTERGGIIAICHRPADSRREQIVSFHDESLRSHKQRENSRVLIKTQ